MSDKRKLFIHMGVHRTATTTIKKTMLKNQTFLNEHNIFLPQYVKRHAKILAPVQQGRAGVETVVNKLNALADKHSSSIDTILLSDENMCMLKDFSFLKPLCRFFDVKVIFAMRRQDLWLESWWPLNVAWQGNIRFSHIPWTDFLVDRERFYWIHYDRWLQHLEELLGIENMRTYVFEHSQMPDGAVAMFCRQFGLDDISGMIPLNKSHVNISFLPEVSEFIRYLPLDEVKPSVRMKLIQAMSSIDKTLRSENPARLLMSPDERRNVMQEYEAGNKAVAQRYFSREQLFFEPMPDSMADVVTPSLPDNPSVLMARLVVPYLRELFRSFDNC